MTDRSRVLVTGIKGFTGYHLNNLLSDHGFECVAIEGDLLDRASVFFQISQLVPQYVVHLAAMSFAADRNIESIYSVNVTGTLNLLDALNDLDTPPTKVILASSATVYGNIQASMLKESMCPKPVNHYGCSKLAMEHMAQNYMDNFPIIITRPFNYSGPFHNEKFLIPKIISAYQNKLPLLELGNLHISREFNDVRDVVNVYRLLLTPERLSGVVNICSGKSVSLLNIITLMNNISQWKINVVTNQKYIRHNEIINLTGDPTKLKDFIKYSFKFEIENTLRWMFAT
jgi:GDP-6-deoxy-D-talose 4-dehydrogenase